MPMIRFSLSEYEPARPHVVLRTIHLAVELDDVWDFHDWAAEHWPAPRWRTQLAPGQTPPLLDFSE